VMIDRETITQTIRDAIVGSHSVPRKAGDLQTDHWLRLEHEAESAADAVWPIIEAAREQGYDEGVSVGKGMAGVEVIAAIRKGLGQDQRPVLSLDKQGRVHLIVAYDFGRGGRLRALSPKVDVTDQVEMVKRGECPACDLEVQEACEPSNHRVGSEASVGRPGLAADGHLLPRGVGHERGLLDTWDAKGIEEAQDG
jgi:hypothetical protein